MPYLSLQLSTPIPPALARLLAGTLTGLTVAILGKKRELTAVSVTPLPAGFWFVGAEVVGGGGPATYHLEIVITEGSNSAQEKADFIAAAHSALASALGPLTPACYIVIRDVDGRAWGYSGLTQAARRREASTADLP